MKCSGIDYVGDVPSCWKVIPNKYIMKKKKCICDKWKNENVLSLTMNGVIIRNLINPVGKMPTTFDGYQYVYPNDLLMCLFDIDVTPRCVGVVKNFGVTSPAYTRFVLYDGYETRYYYYYYLYLDNKKELLHLAKNLRHSFTEEELGYLKTPVPPLSEQQKIADFLDEKVKEIDNAIEKTKETIELYKKYKQAIITEAVTKGLDPNAEMKDSGIDWIKEIPSQWKKIRIKHLFELRNERNYAPLKSVNLLSLYSDIGVIQHDDIEEDVISGNKAINADGYKIVYAGDIVDNIILCWMGAIGISEYNGVTSPAYDIYKPIDETVFTKYFHYLFRTKDFGQKCYTLGRGIMRMRWRVYSEQFMSIYVPVPSFEEQKKIVKSIEANEKNINNMIEAKEYVITKLQSYKQSLIYEYVTGKKEVK